jgi:hypothetical protein
VPDLSGAEVLPDQDEAADAANTVFRTRHSALRTDWPGRQARDGG